MNFRQYLSLIGLYGLVLFWSSCTEEKEQVPPEFTGEPGTALYYYNKGLDTLDMPEKLRLYNKGLDAIGSTRDTMLPSLLEGKIFAYLAMGDLPSAAPWVDSLITIAEMQQDSFYIAKGYYRKYQIHFYTNEPVEAFKNSYKSAQVYYQTGDTAWAGRRNLDMANIQLDVGDYSGAQESATEALENLDREVDIKYVSSAHNVIGLAYMDQGFNEDAIREYRNALRFAINRKDSLSYLHNIAIALKNQEKYDEALEILEEVVQSEEPDASSAIRFLDNLAYTRWMKDPSFDADSLLLKALARRHAINDRGGLATSYSHLSEYYAAEDPKRAKKYSDSLLQLAQEFPSPTLEHIALKKLIELAPAAEREIHVDRFVKLTDSLDQAEKETKFQFAKIRFDEEQKQKQIRNLEAMTMKQALETQQLEYRTLIISLISILGALTAGIMFYYFKQKAKRERLREVYLTENRISKRIHDELANDIYNVMNNLEPIVPPTAVDELEHIYNRTRDISRENAEIETGERYPAFLLSMLSNNAGKAKLIVKGDKDVNWEKIPEEKKIVLYRVLQELMVNMKKHSGAPLVAISFEPKGNTLEVFYSDTGKGTTEEQLKLGNGLKNLANRLHTINGKIEVQTSENKGFKSKIKFPLK